MNYSRDYFLDLKSYINFSQQIIKLVNIYCDEPPFVTVILGGANAYSTTIFSDISSKVICVDSLKADVNNKSSKIEYLNSSVEKTYLSNSSVDLVICGHSLNSPTNDVIHEARRILRNKGVFISYHKNFPPIAHPSAEAAAKRLYRIISGITRALPVFSSDTDFLSEKSHLEFFDASKDFLRGISISLSTQFSLERYASETLDKNIIKRIITDYPDLLMLHLNEFMTSLENIFGNKTLDGIALCDIQIAVKNFYN